MPAKPSCLCGTCRKCRDRLRKRAKYAKRGTLRVHDDNVGKRRKALNRAWHAGNPGYVTAASRKRRGIVDAEIADELLEFQYGKCPICTKPASHADHDHSTGRMRGMLCGECNLGLGKFRDSVTLLRRAADYLERPPALALRRAVVLDLTGLDLEQPLEE